jgi:hypothetical protein
MLGAMSSSAADRMWTGKISDSICGAKHNTSAEHVGKKMSDREWHFGLRERTQRKICIRQWRQGVYNVANQDFAALQEHAGHTVEFTGEMTGDTITVSKIAMPAKK